MNLIGAIVVNLWVAGWVIAMVIAGLKARAVALDPLGHPADGHSTAN